MRRFGLIGYPLSHSFSQKYFTEKFQQLSLEDCSYENYPLVSIDQYDALVAGTDDLEGLNVTVPYKQKVIPLLDRLDTTAEKIGAVNCIHFRKGQTVGYNTDVIGFERSLKPLLQSYHANALILGTGGASRAVAFVLTRLAIAFRYVSRRSASGHYTYSALTEEIMKRHLLIINTTPVGTSPLVHEAPAIPYAHLGNRHLLYDLVYNPPETLFLKKGKARGATVKNGYEMLELQAEASWEIWNHPE